MPRKIIIKIQRIGKNKYIVKARKRGGIIMIGRKNAYALAKIMRDTLPKRFKIKFMKKK